MQTFITNGILNCYLSDSTEEDRGSVHIDDTVDGLGVGGINISCRSDEIEAEHVTKEIDETVTQVTHGLMVRKGLTTSRENITFSRCVVLAINTDNYVKYYVKLLAVRMQRQGPV